MCFYGCQKGKSAMIRQDSLDEIVSLDGWGLAFLDIQTYYNKAIVTKVLWFWYRDG